MEKKLQKPFWQNSWLNINFKELGVELSSKKLASSNFYNAFYLKLFEKYSGYDLMPADWEEIGFNSSVLSYGCGLGYIEKCIVSLRSDLELCVFDYASKSDLWLRDIPSITFLDCIPPDKEFDLIYLSQVLYALPSSDSVNLLKTLYHHLSQKGKLILINTSVRERENGVAGSMRRFEPKLMTSLFDFWQQYIPMFMENTQFWGWHRDNATYLGFSHKAGFRANRTYFSANQSFIVLDKEAPFN